jgi:hypothetical protein
MQIIGAQVVEVDQFISVKYSSVDLFSLIPLSSVQEKKKSILGY